jgi:hypothetical protein
MASERWLVVQKDGQLRVHVENDGARFFTPRPEAVESIISRDKLRSAYPVLYPNWKRPKTARICRASCGRGDRRRHDARLAVASQCLGFALRRSAHGDGVMPEFDDRLDARP